MCSRLYQHNEENISHSAQTNQFISAIYILHRKKNAAYFSTKPIFSLFLFFLLLALKIWYTELLFLVSTRDYGESKHYYLFFTNL